MHGATYTIDAEWSAANLVPRVNWVLNIADASDALSAVVAEWNYRNLDDVPAFAVSYWLSPLMHRGVCLSVSLMASEHLLTPLLVLQSREMWLYWLSSVH